MKNCTFCGNKNLKNTTTEYTYRHDGKYLLIEKVPCIQCEYCGEKYFQARVLKQIESEFSDIYSGKKKVNREIVIPTESYAEIAFV